MFARFSTQPLRRSLHTVARPSTSYARSRAFNSVVGASVLTAGFLTWHLHRERNHLALDSLPNASTPSSTSKPSIKRTAPTTTSKASDEPSVSTTPSVPSDSSSFSSDPEAKQDPSADVNPESEKPTEGSEAPATGGGSGGGAFNPETGEINWDCPCLGGMAHGPCGPQFREAFSCFVFSEDEPKGINCVDKFKAMQDCFRAHPEVYADEIMDDDDDDEPQPTPAGNTSTSGVPSSESGTADDALSQDAPAPATSTSSSSFHEDLPPADATPPAST